MLWGLLGYLVVSGDSRLAAAPTAEPAVQESAPVSRLGKNLLYAPSKAFKAADTTPTDPLVDKDLQALKTALSTTRIGFRLP